MKREDFVFTVGFDGATSVVDGAARRRHGRASVDELLEAGLYRPAACAALWDGDEAAIGRVIETVNRMSGSSLRGREDLIRLFGVPMQALGGSDGNGPPIKVQVI